MLDLWFLTCLLRCHFTADRFLLHITCQRRHKKQGQVHKRVYPLNIIRYMCHYVSLIVTYINQLINLITVVTSIFHNPVKENKLMLKGVVSNFFYCSH
jgi:hypothetical protein